MRRWLRLLVPCDRPLALACGLLVAVSLVAMLSASATVNPRLALRHETWIFLGIAASLVVQRTNHRRWIDAGTLAYGAGVLALVLVEVAGATRLGAQRWLSIFGLSIQPSELAKLATVLWLARYLAGQPSPLPARAFWISLATAAVPMGLILIQPDLGSATIIGAIWLGMVWAADARGRLVGGLLAAGLAVSPLAWHVLKDYQRDRLLVFVNPQVDPLGAGYTIIQSTIAIGSGQLLGRGWRSGTQNQLNFLPEHHSDFIFAVIGEEWGLLGCVIVLLVFGWLLQRMLRIAADTTDPQGRLLAVGLFSWVAYQAFVNIGMVIGGLPVVGVPLPFISYGGSSMIALWIGLGLLQAVCRDARQ